MVALARVLASVLFALVALQIGLASIAVAAPCIETCEDDGPDGTCPPGCEDCLCCIHARVLVPRPVHAGPEPLGTASATTWADDTEPASAEPREIMQIPKRADLHRLAV
jgi:hypothetical protein